MNYTVEINVNDSADNCSVTITDDDTVPVLVLHNVPLWKAVGETKSAILRAQGLSDTG